VSSSANAPSDMVILLFIFIAFVVMQKQVACQA